MIEYNLWTTNEMRKAKELWNKGYPLKKIADELGRTVHNLQSFIRYQRVKGNTADFPYRVVRKVKQEFEPLSLIYALDAMKVQCPIHDLDEERNRTIDEVIAVVNKLVEEEAERAADYAMKHLIRCSNPDKCPLANYEQKERRYWQIKWHEVCLAKGE